MTKKEFEVVDEFNSFIKSMELSDSIHSSNVTSFFKASRQQKRLRKSYQTVTRLDQEVI